MFHSVVGCFISVKREKLDCYNAIWKTLFAEYVAVRNDIWKVKVMQDMVKGEVLRKRLKNICGSYWDRRSRQRR